MKNISGSITRAVQTHAHTHIRQHQRQYAPALDSWGGHTHETASVLILLLLLFFFFCAVAFVFVRVRAASSPGDTMSVLDPDEVDRCAAVWAVHAYNVANLLAILPRN
jgi:hypothetical protein